MKKQKKRNSLYSLLSGSALDSTSGLSGAGGTRPARDARRGRRPRPPCGAVRGACVGCDAGGSRRRATVRGGVTCGERDRERRPVASASRCEVQVCRVLCRTRQLTERAAAWPDARATGLSARPRSQARARPARRTAPDRALCPSPLALSGAGGHPYPSMIYALCYLLLRGMSNIERSKEWYGAHAPSRFQHASCTSRS